MHASVKDLKNNLSAYLKKVRRGEELIITLHNHAVAKLIPLIDDQIPNTDDPSVFYNEIRQLHQQLRKVKLKTSMRETLLARRREERN